MTITNGQETATHLKKKETKMKRKPRILILDRPRGRSPLLTQYYEYLMRSDGPLDIYSPSNYETIGNHYNVIGYDWLKEPIDEIVGKLPEVPDYIYCGFSKIDCFEDRRDWLTDNHVRIITEIGDVNAWGAVMGIVRGLDVRLIVYRVPHRDFVGVRNEEYKRREYVPMGRSMVENPIRDTPIVCMPWSVNVNNYRPRTWLRKDIDISFVCTMNSLYTYHDNRRRIRDVLRKLQKRGVYNIKIATKVYGEAYKKLLSRTKMFIVDTSQRDFLTQKYLEGPANGCMLLGEIPSCATEDFIDDQTIAVTDYTQLEKTIKYWFNHSFKMKQIAEAGKVMVEERYSHEEHIEKVEKAILEDWRGE